MTVKKEHKTLVLRVTPEAKEKFERDRNATSNKAGVPMSQSAYGNWLILSTKPAFESHKK